MTVAWTSAPKVAAALGPSAGPAFEADPYSADVVDAANAWCYRKRAEAGYDDLADDDAPAPSADVELGATLFAVARWRERASTDGFQSFEDLAGFVPTGGAYSTILRLLGVGKGQVDSQLTAEQYAQLRRGRVSGRW